MNIFINLELLQFLNIQTRVVLVNKRLTSLYSTLRICILEGNIRYQRGNICGMND